MDTPKGFALKVAYAKALIARVEKSLGHTLTSHKIDLLCDNDVCATWEQAVRVMYEIDPVYAAPYLPSHLGPQLGDEGEHEAALND